MSLGEELSTASRNENLPFMILLAANKVPIEDYLKLTFDLAAKLPADELKSLIEATKKIKELANDSGSKFILKSKCLFSADPRVLFSRQILKKVPFDIYLKAREISLTQAIERNAITRGSYEGVVGFEEMVETVSLRGAQLQEELNLTKLVAKAAGIST